MQGEKWSFGRDVIDNVRGNGSFGRTVMLQSDEGGKGSFGRDVMLLTVQVVRGRLGGT